MRHLAIFARIPAAGQVKTRLSPALPPALAADLYRAMLADALAIAAASGPDRLFLYLASATGEATGFEVPEGFVRRHQQGNDLGARLAAAFGELMAGPEDRAVIIGADCPDLEAAVIRDAFGALEGHDLVVGPARDGGYYLIGLRRPAPALFQGVAWGTDRVLVETLVRAERRGLAVASLAELGDLDTPADLVRFVARRSMAPETSGMRTEQALRELGLLPPRA